MEMSKSDEQLLQEQEKRYEIEFELLKFIEALKEKHSSSKILPTLNGSEKIL